MKESRCEQCTYYAKLEAPYHYEKDGYKGGVTIYGFCAKNVAVTFSLYPVYIPNGGVCKAFKQKKGEKPISADEMRGQITMEEV